MISTEMKLKKLNAHRLKKIETVKIRFNSESGYDVCLTFVEHAHIEHDKNAFI